MNDTQLETLDQVRQFLEGTEAVSFQIESKDARYRWLQHTLVKFRYLQLSKTDNPLHSEADGLFAGPSKTFDQAVSENKSSGA